MQYHIYNNTDKLTIILDFLLIKSSLTLWQREYGETGLAGVPELPAGVGHFGHRLPPVKSLPELGRRRPRASLTLTNRVVVRHRAARLVAARTRLLAAS